VTVCIATLFQWNYAAKGEPTKYGVCALVASDRMITAGDVEYEPQQLKVAYISQKAILVIAGQYPTHTQAIQQVAKQLQERPDSTPETIAALYGKAIQKIRMQLAEDEYLAPLGMNTDTFIAQQRDMSEAFVASVTQQLQNFDGPGIEALVVGTEEDRTQIWSVDHRGTARCFDDVGFHAIGIGSGHASLSLMQAGYTNNWLFANSLAAIYAAKKVAETAPGVGTNTDIHLVNKFGVTRLWPEAFESLERIYQKYREAQSKLVLDAVQELHEAMQQMKTPSVETGQQSTGEIAEGDDHPNPDPSQAAEDNDGRQSKSVS
jgi:20S proteasome alpha/beta subunit